MNNTKWKDLTITQSHCANVRVKVSLSEVVDLLEHPFSQDEVMIDRTTFRLPKQNGRFDARPGWTSEVRTYTFSGEP